MPIEEISETLKKTAESDKGAAVLLLGDELAKYGDIAKAVDCVRAANIKKLRIRALQKKQYICFIKSKKSLRNYRQWFQWCLFYFNAPF